jgi:adenylate cyclase
VVLPKIKVALSPLRWLLMLGIPALWCVLSHYGTLEFLESRALDWRYGDRGERDAPVKVVYVDIDARSLDELGGWPWNRGYFAEVASTLVSRGGAKAVGIGVVLADSPRSDGAMPRKLVDGNVELARYLDGTPPVVLAASYAEVQFHEFGERRPTLLELPMVIARTIFSPLAPVAPNTVKLRRDSRELPLLDRDSRSVALFAPPGESSLYVGRKQPWQPSRSGLIDTVDGGTTWVPAYVPVAGRNYLHMAVELALAYWGLTADAVRVFDDRLEIVRPDGRRVATLPLQQRQLLEVNWFSTWTSPARNPRFSFSSVLSQVQGLDSNHAAVKRAAEAFFLNPEFKDAIVLIGPVDPMLYDLAPTPFDHAPVPRVGVLGNLLKTVFSGQYIRRLPAWAEYTQLVLFTVVVSLLAAAGGAKAARWKLSAILLVTGYGWFSFWSFRTFNLVLPLVATLGAVFTTSFVTVASQLVGEEIQKRRIKGLFGTYLAPQLVHHMIESGEQPKPGGKIQDLTVYFSDIESFSRFAEVLDADRLVELMNEYLTVCTDVVEEEGGTLDKYIGDAVVAMFGAPGVLPDHAYRACLASQRVQQQLAGLREKWKSEGEKWPEIVWQMQSRIGLNSGPAVVGNIGSRSRLNYTVMGDNVNLAARMESGARHFGVRTMVTEATKLSCEQHGGDRIVFRYLARIIVKGRSLPVPVYEILGLKEDVTVRTRECLTWFEQGMAKYLARDWDAAAQCFGRSEALEPNRPGETPGVERNPSLVFLDRCAHLRQRPPGPDWDGTYRMPEK